MGEQVIVPLDCLTFCDYVGDGICTKTGQTRVGCRCNIFPQRCRDMYYVNTPHRKGPLEICLSNTKNVDCDRLPNTPVYCNCSSGGTRLKGRSPGPQLRFAGQPSVGAISTIRSHGDSGKGEDSDEQQQQQWDRGAAPSSTRETTVGTVAPSTISTETATPPSEGIPAGTATPPSEGIPAGTATPSSDDRSTPGPTPWPAGFKQLVCPSMDACSISLYVPRSSASTLIAHPIYKNGRRVMSGLGQEVNSGFSGPQARREAPTQEGEILSEDPLNPVVVKVFTYAPYSLSVGSYDLVLFGNDHSTGQYVGQLVVIDLNYCLKEGDNETLFNRLVTYSNDVASDGNDHDGFIYPTTQPYMPAPAPPAPAPSVQPAPPTRLVTSPEPQPLTETPKPRDEPPSETDNSDSGSSVKPGNHLGPGAIAGIACGVLLAAFLGFLTSWMLFKLCRRKKEEERDLVGAAAAANDDTLDDNCIDLESVDPLELLNIPAPIAPTPSVVLYPSPQPSMPSTVCSSPTAAQLEYISDDPNVEMELRRAAGRVLAEVNNDSPGRVPPRLRLIMLLVVARV
ncbi:hypothetical protein FOL46_001546 [Perkinsus olseni]|uniref:Uncharacterized protein n=1 Tax=Perkinsus olseni TaxID=32597 RepID=A0A7J6ME07_PEROL|nr:hypothetical protein FOL46_001546 [Perkinsus olseni]